MLAEVRRVLWGTLAIISTFWFFHYSKVGSYYASIFPKMRDCLFFCETWRNVSLILLLVSLIMICKRR